MPLHFVISQKNKKNLINNGFTYSVNHISKTKIIWRCILYYQNKCPARCHTSSMNSNGHILKETDHNHGPEVSIIQAKKVMSQIRKKAATSKEATSKIITTACNKTTVAAAGQMSSQANIARTIRRIRHNLKNVPIQPVSLDELVIPDEYKTTIKNMPFLLCDSRTLNLNINQKFMIFSTNQNLSILSNCDTWFADGTFYTVPSMFYQLYTLHGLVNGHVIPLVYVLMTGKSSKSYKAMLRQLLLLEPRLSPDIIMSDFEIAFNKAAVKVFPRVNIKGCFFHFSQCVWKNIQKCGLQRQYSTDSNYELHLKMLCSLAFVPESDVVYAYEKLMEEEFFINNKNELAPLIEYFENTWIGIKLRRRGRRGPMFDITLWNHYASTIANEHRTNNCVEGWHHAFNVRAGAAHLLLWTFIDVIRDEQSSTEIKIEQIYRGDAPPAKRRKIDDRNNRLKRVVDNYNKENIIEYLRGIAHNLKI